MAVDVTLRWRGALDADSDTDYKITADKTTPGTFATVEAAQDATSPYVPVSTTLNGGITAIDTSITLTDGGSFSSNDYALIGRESVRLGTKSTHLFTGSTRGIGASIPQAHADLVTVYKMHESYLDAAVDFGSRKLIRYKIARVQAGLESTVSEILIANPSAPPSVDYCTVWGVYQDLNNDVQSSVLVVMAISGVNDYVLSTGELIKQANETFNTNTDGYFEFAVPKTIARTGGATITVTVNEGDAAQKIYTLNNVPDQDSVHIQRTA